MYELRDLYKSLNKNQRTLFLKNLESVGCFDILPEEEHSKPVEKQFEMYEKMLEELCKPMRFSEVFLITTFSHHSTSISIPENKRNEIQDFYEIVKDLSKAVFVTFVIKKDILKFRKKGQNEFGTLYHGDLTKHFIQNENPMINFYLMDFELSFLYLLTSNAINTNNFKVIKTFDSDQRTLFFSSLKNLLLNYHSITKKLVDKQVILEEQYSENSLKQKELEFQQKLKDQKIELSKKHKQEKETITNTKNKEVQKHLSHIQELMKKLDKLEKDLEKSHEIIREKSSETVTYKMKLRTLEEKLKSFEKVNEKLQELEINHQQLQLKNESLEKELSLKKEINPLEDVKFDEWLHFTVKNVLNPSGYFSETELFTAKMILNQLSNSNQNMDMSNNDTMHSLMNAIETRIDNDLDSKDTIPKITMSYKFVVTELNDKGYPVYNGQIIQGIPTSLFVQENQVIRVDKEDVFVEIYNYVLPENYKDNKNVHILIYKNGHFYDANDSMVKVKNIYPSAYFKYKQLILVDSDNSFISHLPKNHFSLDAIKAITDKRGHDLYINLQIIENQIYCIDLSTNKERLLSVKNLDRFSDMTKNSTFLVIDNTIVKVFSTPLFYKLSSYYKNKELMTVEIIDNEYYVKNLNKEFVKLKMDYTNFTLHDGDVVWVDREDNNFLYQEESAAYLDKVKKEQESGFLKNTISYRDTKKVFKTLPDVEDSILIIGNPSNQNAYKLGFRKYGIESKTIDGFSNFNEIKKELKNYNHIVFLANFASHDNQAKIKNEDVKVYYPKKDGVNYIYDYIYNQVEND